MSGEENFGKRNEFLSQDSRLDITNTVMSYHI